MDRVLLLPDLMRRALLYLGLYFFLLQQTLASSVTLAWNPSTDPDVINYNLYYGAASGVYTNEIPVGTNSTAAVTGLVPGTTYYFVVTAEDAYGLESAYSNEIYYSVPLLPCNVTIGNLNQIYNGQPALVSVSTVPTNLTVSVTYNGSSSAPTNAGSYTAIATVVSTSYMGATTNTLTISPAPATITLANLVQTYDSSGKTVSATTQPAGLPTIVTYNGSACAPINAGSYAAVCTIVNGNYAGSATNTLIVAQATAMVQLSQLVQACSGNRCPVTVTTIPAGLSVSVTYNGTNQAPSAIGYYTVVAGVNDPNYSGMVTATFRITTVSPPSNFVIISWSASFSPVTLLESTNLTDWETNTDLPETASSDPNDPITTPVAIQPGAHFFRAISNGVGIPVAVN